MFKNCIVILSLIISVCCIEISPEWNQASLAQKRKVYCLMISYHFLDDDMDAFNSLTTNLSSFRVQIFRNRVAYKLSDNCQAKITNEQIMELSKLIEKPSGHEEEIETLEHKYIQYFAPEQDYVLNLVKEVKLQSEVDIKKQIEKFHQTRRHIQSNTGVLIDGFKAVQNHINTTGHHILNVLDNFYKAFHKVHHQINETVHKIKNHPEIKKIQDFWDDL